MYIHKTNIHTHEHTYIYNLYGVVIQLIRHMNSLFHSKSSLHLPYIEKRSIFKPLEYVTKALVSRNYLDNSKVPH